jgi:L-asparaginase II
MPSPAPLVRVLRSGLEESVHTGHIAVCDEEGRLLAGVGDPHHVVFARSSMKPLQAAVSLGRMSGELPAQDLVAVMCGSHNGEPVHVRTVQALLKFGGVAENRLGCPADLPRRTEDRKQVDRRRSVYHNCSGKHAGMLVACERADLDLASYLQPTHPLQREITREVGRATGLAEPVVGVDGCGAPVHGVPLSALATLFARLVRPERLGPLSETAEIAVSAMRAHPYLVAGRDRSDTVIMGEVPDVVCKVGAEALHCAGIVTSGIGMAVKIADGGDRAAAPALVRSLEILGAIDVEQLQHLGTLARPPVLGGGRPVGELVADFHLRRGRV